jgi:hypothetical protein
MLRLFYYYKGITEDYLTPKKEDIFSPNRELVAFWKEKELLQQLKKTLFSREIKKDWEFSGKVNTKQTLELYWHDWFK